MLEEGAPNIADVNATNINKTDYDGWAVLHYAAADGYVQLAKDCIALGANIEARTLAGSTPLHLAATYRPDNCVINVLIDAGANVDSLRGLRKITPLHLALVEEFTDTAKLLIDRGADAAKVNMTYEHYSKIWITMVEATRCKVRVAAIAYIQKTSRA